jgi:hypothetical protein
MFFKKIKLNFLILFVCVFLFSFLVANIAIALTCTTDADCNPNEMCIGNVCIRTGGCTSDADCGPGRICDIGTGVCLSREEESSTNVSTPTTPVGGYGLGTAAGIAGLRGLDIPTLIGKIIQIVLSFVGVIFFILIIYAGFLWMTAGGNEEQVTKAKKLITSAAVGLIIVISAYAITYFILSQLLPVTVGG